MSFKTAGAICACLTASAPSLGQTTINHPTTLPAGFSTLDDRDVSADVASVASRSAFVTDGPLSQRQKLSLLLLMTVPRNSIRNVNEGAHP